MFKLCKSATTNDEDERLFENPEDEAKFDKLIEEAFRLYIKEEWEKEKDIVYPEHEFSERHKKQMKKLFKKVARRERIKNFFRIS
ncbi:MAG: hypothetical protein IJ880_09310 [Bacilli bacterium]|nr:hypothetical protein [Bacilli bacterium]